MGDLVHAVPSWMTPHSRSSLYTLRPARVALDPDLPIIGKLLGHSQAQTTARYARLAADPALATANQISTQIAAAMK